MKHNNNTFIVPEAREIQQSAEENLTELLVSLICYQFICSFVHFLSVKSEHCIFIWVCRRNSSVRRRNSLMEARPNSHSTEAHFSDKKNSYHGRWKHLHLTQINKQDGRGLQWTGTEMYGFHQSIQAQLILQLLCELWHLLFYCDT